MKHQSDKRRAENVIRKELLERLRTERRGCEAKWDRDCTGRMDDGHEVLTRGRGGSITDEKNLLMCCRHCHSLLTDNPKAAELRGLIVPSWVGVNGLDEAAEVRREWAMGSPQWPSWMEPRPNV